MAESAILTSETPVAARNLEGKLRELGQIEALWLQEADRRDQVLDADPSRAIPGIDVMREARALLAALTPGQETRTM